MSWPISIAAVAAEERQFDFRLRDATDKITPEDVTVGDITLTIYYPDGTSDTLETAPTKISGSLGLYRGVFTALESTTDPGNGTVVATCTGCDPELIPVSFATAPFEAGDTKEDIADEVNRRGIGIIKSIKRTGTNGNVGITMTGPDGAATGTLDTNADALPIVEVDTAT